jgi:hypothetical protein
MYAMLSLVKRDRGVLGAVDTGDLAARLFGVMAQANGVSHAMTSGVNLPIQVASATMLAAVLVVLRDDGPADMLQRAGIHDRDAALTQVKHTSYLSALHRGLRSPFHDAREAAKGVVRCHEGLHGLPSRDAGA